MQVGRYPDNKNYMCVRYLCVCVCVIRAEKLVKYKMFTEFEEVGQNECPKRSAKLASFAVNKE